MKNYKISKSLVDLVAPACDVEEKELLYDKAPEYSKYTDLDRPTEILKNKLTISSD